MNACFVMTSRWWVDAAPVLVWPLVGDCRLWPQWLPSMRERHGALDWRMPWPWPGHFEVHEGGTGTLHQQDQWLRGPLRVHCLGVIEGPPGERVSVTLRLGVSLDRPWLQRAAPWLLPWVAQRHFAAVQAGVPRLGQLLGCPVGIPSRWAGYRAR